ncbi:MAG: alpha/beta hydrolase [Gammaproteobacteria bacterium]|jgi:lipase|nr:alpha/beta hydrolase [Gammaproteobacteria bacterium]MBT3696618.1 alpha/beta hydrolase [Gammaproteobacteria bacterium]
MPASPKQMTLNLPDVDLCVFEWGVPGGQQVLLVHATGFHARCWDQIVAGLPEDWHIFAVDMRGHGRSGNVPPYKWPQFGSDLLHVCEMLGLKDAIGVGHSMGGHCVVHACGHQAKHFKHLVLVDPVILSPEAFKNSTKHQFDSVEEHPVARRRGQFSTVADMHDRYAERAPYATWDRQVFADYCEHGLVPSSTGEGLELACPPKVEASVYMADFDENIYPLIASINTPVVVLRANPRDETSQEMDFSASPTWPELAHQFQNGQDVLLPELTHFIAMQDPGLVVDFIKAGAAAS